MPTSPPAGPTDLTSLLQSVQLWIWGFVGLAAIVMLSVIARCSCSPGATPGR